MQASPRSSSFIFVLDRSYQCTQDANTSEFRHLPFEGVYIYICTVICIYIQFSTILYICLQKSFTSPCPNCGLCGSFANKPILPISLTNCNRQFYRWPSQIAFELIVLAWHRKSNWKSMQNFQKSEKGREIFQTPFLRSCFETCRYFEATPLKKLLPTIQNHKAPTPRVDIATKKTGSTFPSKTFRQKWTSGNPKSYRLHVQITTNGTFVTHVHNDPDPPKQHRRFFVVLWLEKT